MSYGDWGSVTKSQQDHVGAVGGGEPDVDYTYTAIGKPGDATQVFPAGHCGLRVDPLSSGVLEQSDHIAGWSVWLRDEDDKVILARLRRNTSTGRPAGNDGFIDRLEAMLGRVLMPKKGERPRKQKKISRKGKKHG